MVYLFISYAVTWIMILGYVISLVRRRQQLAREADILIEANEEQRVSKS